MPKTSIWVLVLAVGIAIGALGSQVLSAPQQEFTRNVLLKTVATGAQTSDGAPLDIYVIDETLIPGGQIPRHYHPGNQTFVVTQGTGVFQEDGKPSVELKPGTVVHMDPKKVHSARNTGTVPIKFMDFGLFEAGQPPSIPVK
ncbi:MAG TPA: cupin domain-containing protein [bacterium]|nr:cupin domain-containing protein [bacterium]